jgi:hypothetical protein
MTYYMPCSSHESFERTKKSYIDGIVEEYKSFSYEEAEVLMEQEFSIEPENIKKEKPMKDRTNFPSPGDDQACIEFLTLNINMFPLGYAKSH